ncbi:bifunctional helix-turn-helix transcriptional regulator/GNAT family N-acetyltransferase [Dinghuibacter silviterrae]|uniref:MarR family transcriptional regulator with acetyltransferase activity n=1 Tax=Dinghuibacter silviterrae TaxID=1539049 RepID=A0A4R8DEW7_9BACT|nr:helix-turn-helix domain-containing GNAT family N-acetyltransferase [Dinghuibacter silviterrae]TDW95818.1 MarR family transcriptional regulator with acetyltransferase activity [Dinghuibacter silviterrae]
MNAKTIAGIRSFNRFYTGFIGLLDRYLLDSDYSLPEARILYELHHGEGVQASDIIDRMGIDKGYLSRILDRFAEHKLISRKKSAEDGRRVHLFLTDKGQKEFEKLDRASDNQLKQLLADLPPKDWQRLKGHMTEIEDLLTRKRVSITDVTLRTDLRPGDIGYVTHLHGRIYKDECNYGPGFEAYVAKGLAEFYQQYDPSLDRVWICEHRDRIVGFLLVMHRPENAAQLRYFILEPEYRGLGLGKKLMDLYMAFIKEKGYSSSYLWTTNEQETAIALYKRLGFVLTEEVPSNTFGKALTEQKYELSL